MYQQFFALGKKGTDTQLQSLRRHNWPKDLIPKEIMCTTPRRIPTPVITQGKTASQMISQLVFISYCLETHSWFSLVRSGECFQSFPQERVLE